MARPSSKASGTGHPSAGVGVNIPDYDNDPEYRAYVKRLVDKAPPLSPEQRDRLAILLRPEIDADDLPATRRKAS